MIRRLGRHAFLVTVIVSLVALFEPGPLVPSGPPDSDKIVHGALFAALALTGRWSGLRALPLGVGLVVYAGLSEILQATLPIRRDGDIRDALADTVGVVLGLLGYALVVRLARRPPS